MKINSVIELKELSIGTNCVVYKGSAFEDGRKVVVVVKVGKAEIKRSKVGNIIVSDIKHVRNVLVNSGVNVPELYLCGVTNARNIKGIRNTDSKNHLIIVEKYAGDSIRDIFMKKDLTKTAKTELLEMCKKFVKSLPENIPLDTNTGNIVYDGISNKLSFIDFVPPDPWLHINDGCLMQNLYDMFPTLKTLVNDEGGKRRYYDNGRRWEKFLYYLNKNSIPSPKLVLG